MLPPLYRSAHEILQAKYTQRVGANECVKFELGAMFDLIDAFCSEAAAAQQTDCEIGWAVKQTRQIAEIKNELHAAV